ncbi:MAG: hypothetical protein NUV82_01540 [Candidatus Komeilibacteria bacterium]|nr:hypothetical protein [Candidatus Komeilibacteria bacterium]
MYLMSVNNSATLGIEISGFQQEIYQLRESNRELQVKITNLQSISRIERLAGEMNMVSVDKYSYISTDTAVAIGNR